MKIRLLIFVISICLIKKSFGQENFSEYLELMKSKVVESYSVNLNYDNELDEISLKFPTSSEHPDFGYSDPGVFNILEIKISNAEPLIIKESFDSLSLAIRNEGNNRLKSNLIYLTKDINDSKYIFISGAQFGCCYPKLFIIQILPNDIKIINDNEFKVIDFSFNEEIQNYQFTGYNNLGETWGGYKTHFEFQSFNYPKVYNISNGFAVDDMATYNTNKEKIDNYGNFLDYSRPVLIINNETNEKTLVDLTEEIEHQYQLKYDDLSRSKLNEQYFKKFNKSELRLMRNEIFASYGYVFSSPDLKGYFENKKWYKPISKNVNEKLTEIEKYNIKLMISIENAP